MKRRTVIILILTFILLLVIFVGIPLFNYVLYPAYQSVKVDCGFEELKPGENIAGAFTENRTSGEVKLEIFIEESNPYYDIVVKHEECHLEQYLENRSYSCLNPIGVYINEAECYLSQYTG